MAADAAERFGLETDGSYVYLTFLGRECRISREDGMAEIRKSGQLLSEAYEDEGIYIKAYVPRALAAKRGLTD